MSREEWNTGLVWTKEYLPSLKAFKWIAFKKIIITLQGVVVHTLVQATDEAEGGGLFEPRSSRWA